MINAFKSIIDLCVTLLNTQISFDNFSFSFSQVWLGIACLGIVIGFVVKLFDM